MDGGEGNDHIDGFTGNDVINGGDGMDSITGDTGADKIFGGAGNDYIWHGQYYDDPLQELRTDGKQDVIDCGPGFDEAVVNVDVDNDLTTNCEYVIPG